MAAGGGPRGAPIHRRSGSHAALAGPDATTCPPRSASPGRRKALDRATWTGRQTAGGRARTAAVAACGSSANLTRTEGLAGARASTLRPDTGLADGAAGGSGRGLVGAAAAAARSFGACGAGTTAALGTTGPQAKALAVPCATNGGGARAA